MNEFDIDPEQLAEKIRQDIEWEISDMRAEDAAWE
ncbi:hypothetical protein ABH899_003992 [Paenibacillus sp. RC84]